MSKTLLIVFHSMTDGARQMAQAAADGAQAEAQASGGVVYLRHATQAGPLDLLKSDGYLFVTPENLAAVSGVMKDFFDRCYYPVLDALQGRPYATMVCAGSDGHNAARQVARIAMGWRLKPVSEPLIVCTHAQTPEAILAPKRIDEEALQACRSLGESMMAGLLMGIF